MNLIVGIGEYAISNKNGTIKTYALASCIALTAFCPKNKIAGMAHIALPSPITAVEDTTRPCYYASIAVPLLINKICKDFGCCKELLEIKLFGGAKSIRRNDYFKIGEKNINAVRDALKYLNLQCRIADIGGTNSRSLEMNTITGEIEVTLQPLLI